MDKIKTHVKSHGPKYGVALLGGLIVKVTLTFLGPVGVVILLTISTMLLDIDWETM